MSRKKAPAFKLRKPATVDMEAFVSAAGHVDAEPSAKTPRRSGAQMPKRPSAKGAARERERTTIYFSPEVRKRLAVYCAERKAEMSEIVDEAVSKFLGRA